MIVSSKGTEPKLPRTPSQTPQFSQLPVPTDYEKSLIQQTTVNIKILERLQVISSQIARLHKMTGRNMSELRVLMVGPPRMWYGFDASPTDIDEGAQADPEDAATSDKSQGGDQ